MKTNPGHRDGTSLIRQGASSTATASILCLGLAALFSGCQGTVVNGGSSGASGGSGGGPNPGGMTGTGASGTGGGGSGTAVVTGSGGVGTTTGTGSTAGGGASGTGSTAGGTGGSTIGALDCSQPKAAAVRARLLSGSQYSNTVLDLFQLTSDPGKDFGDNVFQSLDDTSVEQRANAAAGVAQAAAATLSKWSPCTPPATGDATICENQIIDKIGANAYRHPLSATEKTQLKTLFDAGIKEKDFATGVEWFLTGVLQSPDFLYEIARPAANEPVGISRALAPYEYASRIAYFVWNSLPDDKLFAAAAANELADATKRQTQMTRLLADAKFMRGVEGFYRRWLNLNAFHEVARDATGFDESVVNGLATSLLMSATQLYSSPTPNIASLFSGNNYYMNDKLRAFYGLSGAGTAFTAVAIANEPRRGILTHPALMAMLARPNESFPISRGLFVLRTLACQTVPLPNGLTIPEVAPIQDGVSTRQRFEMHSKNALCASCHIKIDPPGFAFENFDEVGRYRTMDHGQPVDSSGKLTLGNDLDGPFATGDEFLAKMENSTVVRTCFAQQYLNYALSRAESDPADACSADVLGKGFTPSGDLKQLVVSIVATDAFRMRLAEGVAQ